MALAKLFHEYEKNTKMCYKHYKKACIIDFYKFLHAESLDYYIGIADYKLSQNLAC